MVWQWAKSAMEPPAKGWLRPAVLMAVVSVALYANSLDNAFHFDDEHSIVGNPHIRRLANLPAYFVDPSLFSRNEGSHMYRPLVLSSYAANFALGGYRVEGYRLVNLGLHIAVVCLAGLLLQATGLSPRQAWGGALLINVWPLASEPVNYISARSEIMATAFVLGACLAHIRGRRPWLGALLMAGGLLCKSTAIVVPGLILAYELGADRRAWRASGRRLAPYLAVGAVYLWGTRALVAEALGPAAVRPLDVHWLTQVKALAYYLKLLAFPWPLNVEHQFAAASGWSEGAVWASAALLASIAALIVRCLGPGRRFWGLWCFVVLLPTLVVPLNVLVNERRLYPALVGAAALAAFAWTTAGPRGQAGKTILLAGALCLGGQVVQRNQVWASEQSLWLDARDKAPQMLRPYLRLGSYYRQAGATDQAYAAYRQAVALDPENGAVYNNLGNLAVAQKDLAAAERFYRMALQRVPNYLEALVNLGTLYSRQGRHDEALPLFERARGLGPLRADLHNNLGTAYLRQRRYADAERALRRAAELDASASVYFNLGGALEGLGREAEAIEAWQTAVAMDPNHAKPYYRLAALFERRGQKAQAAQAYGAFLRLWRGDPRLAAQARQRLDALEAKP